MLRYLTWKSVVLMVALGTVGSLPMGYRYPTEADRTGDWEAFKAEVPSPFHARADFNGDGVSDDAWILLRDSDTGWGLFVFLSSEHGSRTVIELEKDNGDTPAQRMGLEVVDPGDYETACGKGCWDCEPDEPEKLQLLLPALDFFAFESANSFFWWDVKSKQFVRTWISD